MVSFYCASIDPALLQPSPRTVYYHGLRVYHQVDVWRNLSDDDNDLLSWGWKISNGKFTPVMADIQAGPLDILRINRCGCKDSCSVRCFCRKAGLKSAFSCKECHDVTSSNATEDVDIIHGED